MKTTQRRIPRAPALVVLALLGQVAVAQALAQFDLPAQPLADSLRAVAARTNSNILFDRSLISGLSARPLKAQLTTEAALNQLLSGTGLTFRRLDDKTVTIVPLASQSSGAGSTGEQPDSPDSTNRDDGSPNAPRSHLQLAQLDRGASAGSPAVITDQGPQSQKTSVELEEIVVTAQKRSENLHDVPVPVTAVSVDSLVSTNQLRLQDYYSSVPGLDVTPDDRGPPIVAIRGITTGADTNPTVGIVIDDVPFGSTTALGGGSYAPEIDPTDLQRVEILRGPQGTLYGASSIGGIIKFVTIDPSTDGFSGRLQAGTDGVYNSPKLGYNLHGAVNVPLSDTLAVRVSGYTREDPGYIDNVETGQRGINRQDTDGGRLAALWRPTQDFSLKLSAILQHTRVFGSSDADLGTGLGDLQQSNFPATGGIDRQIEAYSAIADMKLGSVDLTAVTGYSINSFSDVFDYSPVFGPLTAQEFGVANAGTALVENNKTRKLTEEIRLSASIGTRFDWLFGAFYNHEHTAYTQGLAALDPASGASVGSWLENSTPTTFTEYAAFADLTFHFTDAFDIQVGGRESQNRQTLDQSYVGPYDTFFLGMPFQFSDPQVSTKDNSFTYLVTPRYKLSSDLMVYSRLASGYRPGGPNALASNFGLPSSFKPDTTQNYEIGSKGNVLDHLLSFDVSLYYINWKQIQLALINPVNGNTYFANASGAKSVGAELSLESKPVPGLTIGAWVALNDAKLTEAFPANSSAYGSTGDRLPYSARFSSNLSLDEQFALTGRITGSIGGMVSYLGEREGAFQNVAVGNPQRQILPAYAKTDLRAGLIYDSWTANLFVNNVADRRGLLGGGLATQVPYAFKYIQPRAVGISVSKTF